MVLDKNRHVLIFFLDGVGLGSSDVANNPFMSASLPNLNRLLGARWYLNQDSGGIGRMEGSRATLVPTDPNLDMPGRPQSATGQAAILTGLNVSKIVGEHYGPKPNSATAEVIRQGNLFQEVIAHGGSTALLTPYPDRYFEAVDRGKRLLSSVPLAASSAGVPLMTVDDLRSGRAVSPGFTGKAWRDYLGYDDIPILSLSAAGRQIAKIAQRYNFTFFEHWPSDRSGHRGSLEQAVQHLEMIDAALGGVFEEWDETNGLLIITSDHGNIEEKNHRQHSRNPVPTILLGNGHPSLADHVMDLTGIAIVVREFLGIQSNAH